MLVQMNATLVDIQARMGGLEGTMGNMQREYVCPTVSYPNLIVSWHRMALQPMRTANASASSNAPLIYPPRTGQAIVQQLPRCKQEAYALSGVFSFPAWRPFSSCITGNHASQALALLQVPRPPGANADQVKAHFFLYLGI